MTQWHFVITKNGESDLARLDRKTQQRVVEKLKWFAEHFEEITPLPLGDPWRGFFKLRVGDWRVVYEIEAVARRVVVHLIDRRDKIYTRRR
jgi:mRNA interferase RelE/StbE